MLNDILHSSQKDHVPALGGVNDASGSKRLDKLNNFIQASPPLKPWSLRDNGSESKVSAYFKRKSMSQLILVFDFQFYKIREKWPPIIKFAKSDSSNFYSSDPLAPCNTSKGQK